MSPSDSGVTLPSSSISNELPLPKLKRQLVGIKAVVRRQRAGGEVNDRFARAGRRAWRNEELAQSNGQPFTRPIAICVIPFHLYVVIGEKVCIQVIGVGFPDVVDFKEAVQVGVKASSLNRLNALP